MASTENFELVMTFKLENGKSKTVTLSGAKKTLDSKTVKPVGDHIVAKKFFTSGGSVVASFESAYTRQTTKGYLVKDGKEVAQ